MIRSISNQWLGQLLTSQADDEARNLCDRMAYGTTAVAIAGLALIELVAYTILKLVCLPADWLGFPRPLQFVATLADSSHATLTWLFQSSRREPVVEQPPANQLALCHELLVEEKARSFYELWQGDREWRNAATFQAWHDAWEAYAEWILPGSDQPRYDREEVLTCKKVQQCLCPLPPTELMELGLKSILIDERFELSSEFLRACAMKYPFCQAIYFNSDRLWSALKAYPEYLLDIGQKYSDFAFSIVCSDRSHDIQTDHHRLAFFYAAKSQIIASLQQQTITWEQLGFLANYLLNYQLAICQEDFAQIQAVQQLIRNQGPEEIRLPASLLFDLVLGKLALQGIYQPNGRPLSPGLMAALPTFDLFQLNLALLSSDVRAQMEELEREEAKQQRLLDLVHLYLSSIQVSSPSYSHAQMAFGYLWIDQQDKREAGLCFLKAYQYKRWGESGSCEEEAYLLAISLLLFKKGEGADAEYLAWTEEASPELEGAKPLTHQEIKKLLEDSKELLRAKLDSLTMDWPDGPPLSFAASYEELD